MSTESFSLTASLKINQAYHCRSKALVLSRTNLSYFHDLTDRFLKYVQRLDLSFNEFHEFPSLLGRLEHLHALDLRGNPIGESEEIATMTEEDFPLPPNLHQFNGLPIEAFHFHPEPIVQYGIAAAVRTFLHKEISDYQLARLFAIAQDTLRKRNVSEKYSRKQYWIPRSLIVMRKVDQTGLLCLLLSNKQDDPHILGSGASKIVKNALCMTSGRRVALARNRRDDTNMIVAALKYDMRRETWILRNIQHSTYFLRLYTECETIRSPTNSASMSRTYVALQPLTHGNLYTYLASHALSLRELLQIIRQMLGALADLHSAEFIHRDLKVDNFGICITPEAVRVYLIDFGLACRIQHVTGASIEWSMSPFVAPEQISSLLENHWQTMQKTMTPESDVFALAHVLFWILFRKDLPCTYYRQPPEERLISKYAHFNSPNWLDNDLAPIQNLKIKTLFEGLLNPSPRSRLSARRASSIVASLIDRD